MKRRFWNKAESVLCVSLRVLSVVLFVASIVLLITFVCYHDRVGLGATAIVVGALIGSMQLIIQLFRFDLRRAGGILPVHGVGMWRKEL
jgi:hypothetical protein